MAKLILVRHGITSWNKEGKWQGQIDIPISDEGKKQIDQTDEQIRNLQIDKIYTSPLARVKQSEWVIVNDLKLNCPIVESQALSERDYGIYSGKNKWDFEKEVGHAEFEKVRRGWTTPIPKGETMKDVFNRVVPYFQGTILKDLVDGKNVLVVSSGNTLRALMKYLEKLSVEEVEKLDLGFAEIIVYEFDQAGKVVSKEIKSEGFLPVVNHS